ncbi:hypothetical protein R3P38DRAFT_3216387 [Favolaschia claudopus]|uniref:Uncharacterized protein n=1 Tax=Favolaschia claudopus TaxID=2862362 RepID=A0AAV9YZ38_9AGAR
MADSPPSPRIDFTIPLLFEMSSFPSRSLAPFPFPQHLLSTPQGSRAASPSDSSSEEEPNVQKLLGYEVITTHRVAGLPTEHIEHILQSFRDRYRREGHPESRNTSGDALARMSRNAQIRLAYDATRASPAVVVHRRGPHAPGRRAARSFLHPIPRSHGARIAASLARRERYEAWDNVDPEDIKMAVENDSDDEMPPLIPPPREEDDLFHNNSDAPESAEQAGLRRWAANGFITWFPPIFLTTERPFTEPPYAANTLDEPHLVKIYTASSTREGECHCEDGKHKDWQEKQGYAFRADDGTLVVQQSKMVLVPMV